MQISRAERTNQTGFSLLCRRSTILEFAVARNGIEQTHSVGHLMAHLTVEDKLEMHTTHSGKHRFFRSRHFLLDIIPISIRQRLQDHLRRDRQLPKAHA